tara:strand:+ start:463 stop:675 length:213 start_codon:yes stop_codon:yes gene_type:complete
MRIYRRVVTPKRHTVGYMISGHGKVTRNQAVKMASKGDISGVRVARGRTGKYLVSTTSRKLYDLPIIVEG